MEGLSIASIEFDAMLSPGDGERVSKVLFALPQRLEFPVTRSQRAAHFWEICEGNKIRGARVRILSLVLSREWGNGLYGLL